MFARSLAALTLVLGLGVATDVAPARAETPADTFVMAKNIDDIITLDPAEVFEFSGAEVVTNIYEKLVGYEAEAPTELVGTLAESWTVSDDGKTITFKLRPGVKFHSGNPLTADDVAYSLQRAIILDKTPAFILSQFGWNKDNVKGLVKALDPMTAEITIPESFAPTFVLNCLSAQVASIVDMKTVMANEKDGDMGYEWMKTNSAGSGPFMLKSWKPSESVTLEANAEDRHGAPAIKRVIIRHISEPSVQSLLLEKGDTDLARNLTPELLQAFESNPEIAIEVSPKTSVYYLGLNQKNQYLSIPKVRQAMRWLVDYQGMADSFLKGRMQVHQAFWPSGFFASLDDKPFKLDVDKAKALLAEAGYPEGFSIKFDASNTWPSSNIAQAVQETMGRAGIKVEIVPGEQGQVIKKYRARNHEMVLLYWGPDYLDPHSNADSFARNPDNSDEAATKPLAWRNAWDIPELTKETDAAVRELDAEKRKQMYLDIQRKVQADSPFIVMFQESTPDARRANVTGFVSGPSFDIIYYRLVTKS